MRSSSRRRDSAFRSENEKAPAAGCSRRSLSRSYFAGPDASGLVDSLVLLDAEPLGAVALPEAEPLGVLTLPATDPLCALPLWAGAEGVSAELLLDDALPGAVEPLGAVLLLDELLPGALAGGFTVVLELDDDGASRPPPARSVLSTRHAEIAVSAALTAATSINGRKSIYAPFADGSCSLRGARSTPGAPGV